MTPSITELGSQIVEEFTPVNSTYKHVTEGSILANANTDGLISFSVGNRKRYATCSGVSWLDNEHLAVVNLYGNHLRVYQFNPNATEGTPVLTLLHELKQGLSYPETVAVSPDGSMLSIAHSMSREHGLSLHMLDTATHKPLPSSRMLRIGTFHAISFSPNSRHLIFSEIGGAGYIEVMDLVSEKTTCMLANRLFPLKQKGIALSRDGRYVLVVSAINVSPTADLRAYRCVVCIHRYHDQKGVIDEIPLASYEHVDYQFTSLECCTFLPIQDNETYRMLLVDQAQDTILAFEFNDRKKRISLSGIYSNDTTFPHGIAVSPNGQFIVSANYGDDTLRFIKWSARWPSRAINRPQPAVTNIKYYGHRLWLPGKAIHDPNSPTLLLCGHAAGEKVFGAERSLLDLLEAFSSMRWNVIVTLPGARNADYLSKVRGLCQGIYVFDYDLFSHNSPSEITVSNFARIIEENNVSVVHVNTITLFEPLLAASRLNVKSAIHARELISNDPYLERHFGIPSDMLISRLSGLTNFFIANSSATQEMLVNKADTCLLYNAIDADKFNLLNQYGKKIRFGLLSSNIEKKGLEDFVEIAKRCHALRLDAEFIAIGPHSSLVKKLIQNQGKGNLPENILFPGYYEDSAMAVAEINVLLNLSHVPESFGRSVAEALAAGRPVIAYRLGALPEIVDDGESGFLIPFKDIDAAVNRVTQFCLNPDLIRSMGTAGRKVISKRFSKPIFAENLAKVYEEITSPHN